MSDSRGTPCSVNFSLVSSAAATIGSAEFLLPEISILPLSRVPPEILKLSILPIHEHTVFNTRKPDARKAAAASQTAAKLSGLSASPLADDQSQCCRVDNLPLSADSDADAKREALL